MKESNKNEAKEFLLSTKDGKMLVEILTDTSSPSVIADRAIEFFINHETFDMKRETIINPTNTQ